MEAMCSGMQSYWEKDGGVTPQQAFEASKTVNDDIVFFPIFDKNGAAMFDENGKFVAKVKPGYNDLDWLKALGAQVIVRNTQPVRMLWEKSMIFSLLSAI